MNTLTLFKHEHFGQLRIINDETTGEPWFVAKDVCTVLELPNVGQALNALDEDEKSSIDPNIIKADVGFDAMMDAAGMNFRAAIPEAGRGGRHLALINEPGLYSLVLRSRKPEAKTFKRWVTHEILPSIRKHGAYMTPETLLRTMQDPRNLAVLFTKLAEEQEAHNLTKAELAEAAPKAQLVDATFADDQRRPMRLSEVVRKLDGVNTMAIKRDLKGLGYFHSASGQYRVTSTYRGPDKMFVEKFNRYSGEQDIYATTKGAALIATLYYEGKLTMKRGYQ